MPAPSQTTAAFDLFGPPEPISPVMMSVPHAGRDYPATIRARARVGVQTMQRLEDRHADLLIARLVRAGHGALVARLARAVIDLNRDEREIDPATVRGVPNGHVLMASGKVRGGLGLLPRRLQHVGDLWLGPFEWAEVAQRIAQSHRPYHEALAMMMRRARDVHGHAILLDVHSMPSLPVEPGRPTPRVVLGDRFGRSASNRLVETVAELCEGAGLTVAQNHPYPGSYLLDRHGRPDRNMHAIQIEIDRSLYLDAAHDAPGKGLSAMQDFLLRIGKALADALPDVGYAQAAE